MLHAIHIQNYAVIDNLTVEFQPGLNLLSGETGSGKSILVDALGLALGGRASSDVIRTGADRATVTAIFRVAPASSPHGRPESGVAAWLDEYGIASGDDSEIILRREIQPGGKSRLLVNDQPVTLGAVKNLARRLVEVHGQNEHVALFSRQAQLDLLDQFADAEAMVERVSELYARRRDLEREMESLNQDEQERLRKIDLLQFQAQELERARLEPGEDASLEAQKQVLGNLEKIRAAAATAFGELYEEEGSASARLTAVTRSLDELRRYDAKCEAYAEPLAAARATLDDLAFFLRDYLETLQADPHRLSEIEDRLAVIDRLKRKYGATVEEILAYGERTRQELSKLEHADERRAALSHEVESALADYRKAARKLSEERRAAAKKLEKLVRAELAQVGMEKTRFEVHFETRDSKFETQPSPGSTELCADSAALNSRAEDRVSSFEFRASNAGNASGIDEVELLISPNPGEDLRPLERIASGGELSRLMLALKTVVGQRRIGRANPESRTPNPGRLAPTFVFDEVDAGIGGRAAESIGQRLKRLARGAQVLCVTHLPQIACFADHHYYVEKLERAGRTVTTVTYLESQRDRAAELARMLSGSRITDAVLKHAATMLKLGAGTTERGQQR